MRAQELVQRRDSLAAAGVEQAKLCVGLSPNGAVPVGGAREIRIVEHDHDPVGARVHVELQPIGAGGQPGCEGGQSVLGLLGRRTPMREQTRARAVEVARGYSRPR
jgi:hypothetical protein